MFLSIMSFVNTTNAKFIRAPLLPLKTKKSASARRFTAAFGYTPKALPKLFSQSRLTKPSRASSSSIAKPNVYRLIKGQKKNKEDFGIFSQQASVSASLQQTLEPQVGQFSQFRRTWQNIVLCLFLCVCARLCADASFGYSLGALFASVSSSTAPAQNAAIASAWAGLSAGIFHTLAGPDHLAGLTPLTLGKSQLSSTMMGALWGFGHSSGQMILGLAFVLLKWAGTVVGLTLIAIGLMGLYESHFLSKDEEDKSFISRDSTCGEKVVTKGRHTLGTYVMGVIYGLQPDSFFVVLPALTLPTRIATLSYLILFVFGTVIAMGGYSFIIGTASSHAAREKPWILKHLSTLAAAAAISVGAVILLTGYGFALPWVAA